MNHNHKLDKSKIEAELIKRGWKLGVNNEWITPTIYSFAISEKDWTDAVLAGVVCSFEEQKKETEEFLKKHPMTKRS